MRTLDNWAQRLLAVPLQIECPSMQVLRYDKEVIFTGPGHISIKSRSEIEFVMHGQPRDAARALARIALAKNEPYSPIHALKVLATDYENIEWNCGYVDIQVGEVAQSTWRLSGSILGIQTLVDDASVYPEPGIEVIYDAQLNVPFPLTKSGSPWGQGAHQRMVEVEGGEVGFLYSHEHERLWVTAAGFPSYLYGFLQTWIGEPLNLLLGHFPLGVARPNNVFVHLHMW